jgi:hypothetical protein
MSIGIDSIIQINPRVIGTGGTALALNGAFLSKSALIPTIGVKTFTTKDAVGAFFGTSSAEYGVAGNYFLGYDNSTIKPAKIIFAPYADAARAAWLQGGSLAGMTLAELQALGSGTLIITVDGVVKTSGTIALGSAISFTNAATLIAAAFSGAPVTVVWNATLSVFIVTIVTTGASSTIGFAAGTLAAGLKLTSATGATLSQGVVVDTPTTAMDNLKNNIKSWALFTTMWEPDTANKTLFAVWINSQNQRYGYVAWDTDAQAIVQGSTTSFGYLAKAAGYNTVFPAYNTLEFATFILGTCASIDWSRLNGRITFAFKSLSGLTPTVTNTQTAANLEENGYSYYGDFASNENEFKFTYNSQVSGSWKFLDSYVNQVYLNSQFELSLATLLTSIPSIPYNNDGYTLVRNALQDPIVEAINFGSIRTGVSLSSAQKSQVSNEAGRDISSELFSDGYYLQILDPTTQVRGNRGTPVINFWYMDGGSIQKFTMASTAIL